MRIAQISILALFLLSMILIGCDSGLSGEQKENIPPKTYLTVNEINRSDDNRLSSQINISWWGDDPDGYVVGYEFAIKDTSESASWTFTERTDSTFILPISFGQDIDDVVFKIRAVDNEGAKDPVGAWVTYPIKNSDPTVQIVPTESAPDTTYDIVSFGWIVDDPDGFQNLQSTEIAFNDTSSGSWIDIPLEDDDQIFISLEIGENTSKLFRGRSYRQTNIEVNGIQLNAPNKFYVRTIDKAGAVSPVDTLSWFVKERASNVLFLNDVDLSTSSEVIDFHKTALNNVGITNMDYWDISDGEFGSGRKVPLSQALPSVIDPTLKKILARWDHIYWVSNDLDRNITYAQEILDEFLTNGGTVFFNIPSKRLSNGDPLFEFLPITSLASFSGQQIGPLIRSNTELTPFEPEMPVMQVTQNITNVYSFEVSPGTIPLYEAEVRARTVVGGSVPYDGPKTVALENPEGNLIYFGIDLRQVNGYSNVGELLDYLLNQKLCFDGNCQ